MADYRLALTALAMCANTVACGRGGTVATPGPVAPARFDTARAVAPSPEPPVSLKTEPVLPPQQAFLAGMMPLRATGVDTFRERQPTFDGRGVIIGILDSGLDPGLPGFRFTTTGESKLLDLRDFSGEGRVELRPVAPAADGSVVVGTRSLSGFGRVARFAGPPYYAGLLRELPLGKVPAGDLNGNGRNVDEFPVLVAKSATGWFAVTDTDGDSSLENEVPIYDYAVSGQTFTYAPIRGKEPRGGLTIAVNLSEDGNRPVLDLFFDNSGHGSHVAGIAAGHNLFGIEGFDGVAPGAQLLAAKISNNARGGISVTGSMLRAMNYAADYAERRRLPLILNLSFGVGNELEGAAVIDSMVDEFALKHPGVLLVISAGNDGPGLSTVGFPGSARLALTTCATFPGVFAQPPDAQTPPPPDVVGWWSARGGEVSKPDLCAPGVAFSNVPPWHIGEEISGGTSMAAPQVSGLAALLQSGLVQQGGRPARAVDIRQALMATARAMPGATTVEQGTGVPNVGAAHRWLLGAHQTGIYRVEAIPERGTQTRSAAAYRRSGLASAGDTIQRFVISSVGGQSAARLALEADVSWLRAPSMVDLRGVPETVTVTYDARLLQKPGWYVGTVRARSASDTLAGTVLELVNTVIVPWPDDQPIRAREALSPGRVSRYFVNVGADGGGLTVQLSLTDRRSHATLYLFEPDGKPYRGGGSVEAGDDSTNVTLRVSGDDVVPGTYEIAVQAPPNAPIRYLLEVNRPRVALSRDSSSGTLQLRNLASSTVASRVKFHIEGIARDTLVVGYGSRAATVKTPSPPWADRLVVDVVFEPELWNTVTDFGLTVFDPEGQLLSEGPMNYSFTRQVIKLDGARRGVPLEVELYPAFAHLTPPEKWIAGVRIAYLAPEPFLLAAPDSAIRLDPGSPVPISIPPLESAVTLPDGFRSVVRVTTVPDEGVPSMYRELR